MSGKDNVVTLFLEYQLLTLRIHQCIEVELVNVSEDQAEGVLPRLTFSHS